MKLKAVLVDDEILNLKNLEIILNVNFQEIEILALFQSVNDARIFLEANTIDLLFLDVSMPVENGFDLLHCFPKRNFQVIFVTAHEEYAIKALRVGAIDYILKPILLSELKTAIESVKSLFLKTDILESSNKISLSYEGGKSIIDKQDILYIKCDDNISTIYLTKKRKISLSKTLKYFEDLLDADFVRIHKSYLLNLKYASKIISKNIPFIELEDGTQLPISRRNYVKFKALFQQ